MRWYRNLLIQLWKPGSSLCLVRLAGCPTVSPRGLLLFNGTDLHRMVNRSMMPNTVFTCTTTSVFYSRPLHFFDTTHGGTVQLIVSRLCSTNTTSYFTLQRITTHYTTALVCVYVYMCLGYTTGSNAFHHHLKPPDVLLTSADPHPSDGRSAGVVVLF